MGASSGYESVNFTESMIVGGSESSPSSLMTSRRIEILNSVSDISVHILVIAASGTALEVVLYGRESKQEEVVFDTEFGKSQHENCLPVISSGNIESRTSLSSICSSRPIFNQYNVSFPSQFCTALHDIYAFRRPCGALASDKN